MSSLFRINLDVAGVIASIICALHCIAIPLIFSLGLTSSGHLMHDHTFDIIIIVVGLVIASLSLINDIKKHKSFWPLILVFIGFIILGIGLTKDHHNYQHLYFSLIGSCFVISAHLTNWKMGRNCNAISH
jgi:di/tricarboxylate transporter